MDLPTCTVCNHCGRTMKLKKALWEPCYNTHGDAIGVSQWRKCRCGARTFAAFGTEEFIALVLRHSGEPPQPEPQHPMH